MRNVLAFVLLTWCLSTPLAAQSNSKAFYDSFSSDNNRPFEFTDTYYFQNGVNPNLAVNRRTGTDGLSIFDTPPSNIFRNIRVKITIPAYDHSGDKVFWYLLGEIGANAFTNDDAGREARIIADRYKIYVFPRRAGNPLQLGNGRQADLVDLRNGYFSNDPLGLWQIVFVNYTPQANIGAGRKRLQELANRNGLSLDGTPVIKTLSELQDLTRRNLVTQRIRNTDGSEGETWSLCPVIKDPRNGVIAPDAFLANVRQPDGSPLPAEQGFVDEFNCLKNTGDYCNNFDESQMAAK